MPGRHLKGCASAPILSRAATTGSIDLCGIPEGDTARVYTSHPSRMCFEPNFISLFHLWIK